MKNKMNKHLGELIAEHIDLSLFFSMNLNEVELSYFGYNAERLPSNSALNGISSQNSNIVVRVDIGTATTTTATCLQIFHHDCILKYDPIANSMVVMR